MSAKGERDKSFNNNLEKDKTKDKESKEKDKEKDKEKYYNDIYTYQKLKSLKWMGGPYKTNHVSQPPIWKPSAEEQALMDQL